MLNKDEETAQTSSTTESRKASHEEAVLKVGPRILGADLDDPDSLWERPAKLYVLLYSLLDKNTQQSSLVALFW